MAVYATRASHLSRRVGGKRRRDRGRFATISPDPGWVRPPQFLKIEEIPAMSGQPQALTSENSSIVIRRASPADAETCGRICFEAFKTLADQHHFPMDFPAPEVAIGILSVIFSHPRFF